MTPLDPCALGRDCVQTKAENLEYFLGAADTFEIEDFLARAFPSEWTGIAARILETGATMSATPCHWAPRWSPIPPTMRKDHEDPRVTAMKSIIFRVHDCLHQLWGLPFPGEQMTEDDRYYYKRSQMCGEVAVLTLTEFVYCKWLYDTFDVLRPALWSRNAIPLLYGPLKGKNTHQLAMKLDDLLHKKSRPKWVRDNPIATAFCDDYVPMLETDRETIDKSWEVMKSRPDFVRTLRRAPTARYGRSLDGLELTLWMIKDFYHLISSEPALDMALVEFNRDRRSKIVLPEEWPC